MLRYEATMGEPTQTRVRWFHVTPGRCLAALLAVEGLLFLTERFRWLPKGWSVLTAVAAVAVVLVLMFLWFVVALIVRCQWQRSARSLLVLVLVLLVVGACFMLCELLGSFDVRVKMGWGLTACLVAVGLALLLRFVAKLPFRWQFQFDLRSLMMLVLLVAILCSWMTARMREAKQQAAAVEALWATYIIYDYNVDASGQIMGGTPNGTLWLVPGEAKEPIWLRNLLGPDFFKDVVGAFSFYYVRPERFSRRLPITDAGLERINGLPRLRWLDLAYTEITDGGLVHLKGLRELGDLNLAKTAISDAGLEHLAGLTQLRVVNLTDTQVTEAGVARLQQALPNCKIVR